MLEKGRCWSRPSKKRSTGLKGEKLHPDCFLQGGNFLGRKRPELAWTKGAETNRLGSLSGLDGIVSILNQSSGEGRYTLTSRAVKHIYDAIQDSYDGERDPKTGNVKGYRTTFFSVEETVKMAAEFEGSRRRD